MPFNDNSVHCDKVTTGWLLESCYHDDEEIPPVHGDYVHGLLGLPAALPVFT
jgi:hypothetical protein